MKAKWIKINTWDIVRDHVKSLANANTGKPDWTDLTFFLLLPIGLTVALAILNCSISNHLGILISALAIFIGLFFNVCLIIVDIVKKNKLIKVESTLYKEIIANICFSILLSITCIATSVLTLIENPWVSKVFTWITFFLIFEFIFTLLMILKRVYKVFTNELNRPIE